MAENNRPKARRGRRARRPTHRNPPQTPLDVDACDVVRDFDDVDDVGVCQFTHHQHQHQQHHIDNVVAYLRENWGVIGARDLVDQFGVEIVHSVAIEVHLARRCGQAQRLTNPPGFIVWKCRQLQSSRKQGVDRLIQDL